MSVINRCIEVMEPEHIGKIKLIQIKTFKLRVNFFHAAIEKIITAIV